MDWQNLPQEEVYIQIGEKLKKMRKENHFSQEKLAEHTGLSRSTIKRMEMGKSINFDSLLRVFRSYHQLDRIEKLFESSEISPMDLFLKNK